MQIFADTKYVWIVTLIFLLPLLLLGTISGAVYLVHGAPTLVNFSRINNTGFENTSCPQTQDLVTCGWFTNTQDCTFLSTCSIVTSASAPQGSNYFHAVGAVGQGQQNNDLLGNTTTSNPSDTPLFEVFVRWNTITSCQGVGHACLFKLAFVFNGNSKLVNYYWTNNFTIFSSIFTNSSSSVFFPMNGICGALIVSANFCDFTDSSFMTRAQTYYSNSLTSYGFGQGSASFANHPVFYSIDMSYGCFVISPAVCNLANWNIDVDYVAVGALNGPIQTNVNSGATGIPILFVGIMAAMIIGPWIDRKRAKIIGQMGITAMMLVTVAFLILLFSGQ